MTGHKEFKLPVYSSSYHLYGEAVALVIRACTHTPLRRTRIFHKMFSAPQ